MSVRISRAAFTLTVVAATMVATVIPAGATVPAKKAKDVKVVKVVLTDDGCPAKLTVKAGPNTFEVSNTGSGSVSEFEILSGDRIIGEVENIAPGLTKAFRLTQAWKQTSGSNCPGGDKRPPASCGHRHAAPSPRAQGRRPPRRRSTAPHI